MMVILVLLLVYRENLVSDEPVDVTKSTRSFYIEGKTYQYNVPIVPAFILSLIVGVLSGLFGIGGGTISVPALILFFGIPVQVAIATSMFMILFISIISTTTHIYLGHIVWKYVIFFIIGSYLGGTVGARTSKYLRGRTLEWILRAVIGITGIHLIIEGL